MRYSGDEERVLRTISAPFPHILRLYVAEKVRRMCRDCAVNGWSIYQWSRNRLYVIRESSKD